MDMSLMGHNPRRYFPTHPLYPHKNKFTRRKKLVSRDPLFFTVNQPLLSLKGDRELVYEPHITIFIFIFWPRLMDCGILVPRPGIEPGPSVVKAWSPNHLTTGEFPTIFRYAFQCEISKQTPLPPQNKQSQYVGFKIKVLAPKLMFFLLFHPTITFYFILFLVFSFFFCPTQVRGEFLAFWGV